MIQGKSYSIGQVDGLKYIEIPKGWSRILENGSIQYISPSSSHLKCYEHVIEYLKVDGTCKCGLDCPFYVHQVFNFDVSIQNKEQKDESPNKDNKSSMCKLCDKNGPKGKRMVDKVLLQKQPLKQSGKKSAKFSPFDGTRTSKKASSRSRAKLSDGPKSKKTRKVSSPLSDIPSPPPIPISSPVQNVPNNIGALNQGPLPSFASIVSSSKFFNPGPNRGPLHPTGSLPLKTNNEFTFPKAVSNTVTTSTVSIVSTTAHTVTTLVSNKKPSLSETFPSIITTGSTTTSSSQSTTSKLNSMNNVLTVSTPATTASSTVVSLLTNVSNSKLSESVCKPAVVPIISTPTLPSAFAPLDGVPPISTDTIKASTKPLAKPKSRSRPTPRARSKPKSDKSKVGKVISNATPVMHRAPLTAVISSPAVAAATTFPVSSQWPVPMSSVMSTVGQVPYHIPCTVVTTTTSVTKNVTSSSLVASSYMTGNSISRPLMTQSLLKQATMPSSIYMTAATNYPNQGTGQAMQMASAAGANLQPSQVLTTANQSNSAVGNGKDSAVLSPTIATPSGSYPVVATPRIQPPPGMMYVATAPGVGMFPANYPYVAATPQQLQISQASYSQPQNKSSSTTTTVASTNQQSTTQGVSTDAGQGKVSFQVPGMYVQGAATNQMFPLGTQGYVNQYKGAYQLQNAMYPGAVQGGTMAFIAANGAKATYPGIQTMAAGNIGQFAAYTNPYMLGIVMTTSTNQPSSVPVTSTRSSPATQTCVTTSLQMIQPQSLQNPAIAAAFESFVPIAPAAGGTAPRFAQTLAHLASAYNAFPAGGLVQGPNPNQLHLAYQMMQMNPHSNTQQAANVGGMVASDGSLKHTSAKQGQATSAADTSKGSGNTQSKSHSVPLSPTSSVSPVSTSAQDGGGIRSPFASPPITALQLPISPPPCTSISSAVSVTQTHQSITTKSDHVLQNQKPLPTQLQDKCAEPVPCSVGTVCSSLSGIESSCSDTQRLIHETNKTTTLSSNNTSQGIKPVVTAIGSVSTDQSSVLAVTESPSHYSISPLQNQQNTLPSALSEGDTSKNELSCEVKSQKYHHQVEHDNLNPVRTPNFPVEQKLNFPSENTGASNSHCSRSQTETPPNQINSCGGGGVLISETSPPTRTLENRDPVIPTNYVDKVNYYETNPLLGMKRSCEAIEVYPDLPENPNCTEDDKEDYYSSNEESTEDHPFGKDDTTSDTLVDHRQGENRHMEEPFRISNQVHNSAPKDLYNGGCNETFNEPDIQSKFPNMKPNPTFVGESFRPEMFGELSIPHIRPHFDVGDVVWAQARGLPSWPGKIVDESKVGKGKADDGKKWVMWFGDHTFSQVEVDRLKTLNDGLRTLDDKARKKKYRAKKARISLEQAISEALEELEMRKQLRARQAAMRPKTKKKRLR